MNVSYYSTMMDSLIEIYRLHNATTAPLKTSPALVRQFFLSLITKSCEVDIREEVVSSIEPKCFGPNARISPVRPTIGIRFEQTGARGNVLDDHDTNVCSMQE